MILIMFTVFANINFSYAVIVEEKILIGNVITKLAVNISIITFAFSISCKVIEFPKNLSTFKYNIYPTIPAIIPIIVYIIKNIPCNWSSFSCCLFVLYLAVYTTIALPNPKSKTVKYEITDATSEYSPYSDCPNVRVNIGV